jgi:GGDEF domain-containing protein
VTASFGFVTAYKNTHSLTSEKLIAYADSCLYESKKAGRNKITGIEI